MPQTKPTSEQVTFLAAGTGATQRTALDKLRDVVSVKDFGAVGDGVIATGAGTDNTAAFQAAINSVATYGTVIVPNGIYKLSSQITIPSGKTLRGMGGYATILLAPAAFVADGLVKANGAGGPPTVISDLTVTSQTGGAGAASIGIHAAANGTLISNVWCAGFASNITLANTDVVLQNSVSEVSRTGGTGVSITSSSVTVADCVIYDCYLGLSVSGVAFVAGTVSVTNVRTSACTYAGFAIDSSSNVSLTNCSACHNNIGRYTFAGLYMSTSSNVSITNFIARLGSGPSTTARGISCSSSSNVTIVGCQITSFDDGIYVSGGGLVQISSCALFNNNNRGIYVAGSSQAQINNSTCITNGSGIATNAGIYSDNSAAFGQHIISNNICTQATGGVQDYGIYANIVNNGASSGFTNIIGNVAQYNSVAQISPNGVTANITSTGNI